MMKISNKLLVTTIHSLSVASAFADQSASMKVSGAVTAGSCTTDDSQLSVNFGPVTPLVEADGNTILVGNTGALKLVVTCTAPTAITIKAHDDNSTDKPTTRVQFYFGSFGPILSTDNFYGLIDSTSGKNIGAYALGIDGGKIVGVTGIDVLNSPDGKTDWNKVGAGSSGTHLVSNSRPYFMFATPGTTTSVESTSFSLDFSLSATALKDRLPANVENVVMDGAATFEIIRL